MKDLHPGDILLVADGRSIVAKGITEFMRQYCQINGYAYKRLYHHAAMVIRYEGSIAIAEALGRGWVIHSVEDAYTPDEYDRRVDVFRPRHDWAEREIKLLSRYAQEFNKKVTRYDYMNFLFQMYMIYTGVWVGPSGARAEGRLYCSEGVATIINRVRSYMCEEPWRYNPMDLYLEPTIIQV